MRFGSATAIKAMVSMGREISMLPLWAVSPGIRQHMLSLIGQREQPLISQFALLGRKAGSGPRAAEAFPTLARLRQAESRSTAYDACRRIGAMRGANPRLRRGDTQQAFHESGKRRAGGS